MKTSNKTVPVIKRQKKAAIKGRQKIVLEAALKLINADLKTINQQKYKDLVRVFENTFGPLVIFAAERFEDGETELALLREQHARLYRFQIVSGEILQ